MESWVRECGPESSCQALAEGFLLSQAREEKQQTQVELAKLAPLFPKAEKAPLEGRETLLFPWTVQDSDGGGQMAPVMCPGSLLPSARVKMASVHRDQGLVSFEEVAVHFTEEEWALLDPDQKALHSEVMEENWGILTSLGAEQETEKVGAPGRALLERVREKRCKLEAKQKRGTESSVSQPGVFHDTKLQEPTGKGKKGTQCSVCGKTFSRSSGLYDHWKIHSGERPHQCLECGKYFSQKRSLTCHYRTHTGEKPYKCLECGKNFRYKSDFRNHQRIHTGEKPHKCLECGKNFYLHKQLRAHQRIHSGEKPFNCWECGKCFTEKRSLTSHYRVHTGERPYKCLVCGNCFRHKGNLTSHCRIHTGEKPHKCSECGKCFNSKGDLTLHNHIHTEQVCQR